MIEYSDFNNQIPSPKLDPLLMGEVMGADAFSEGDWVLLRSEENKPMKVTCCYHDLIFVDHGAGDKFEDSFVHFYPEELGYPLDHRFWSKHQKRCYLRCYVDPQLHIRWKALSSTQLEQDKTKKLCILGLFLSLIALFSKVFDYIARVYSVSTLVGLSH